jgi:ubiquinone/menaquinone biosynthesis C-methylase UbiE
MGRFTALIYDCVTRGVETACLGQWRAELLGGLQGQVLEVGAGTGVNLPYYPRTLTRLTLSEPDPHMRRQLSRKVRALGRDDVAVVDASLERLPMADRSFDAVVATLVLCSVPRPDRALAEIYRILKPGGRFVFVEHVAAEERPGRLKWQRRVEPIWKRVSGNCHLTRRTGTAIAEAGFKIADMKRESMRKAWSLVRATIRGVALKPMPPAPERLLP